MAENATATKTIESLADLPSRWLHDGPLARVVGGASYVIRPPFELDNMALTVYDLPSRTVRGCVAVGTCPGDFTGDHAYSVMTPLMVADFAGEKANEIAVDGLAPSDIVHIKAHSVAQWRQSNWDMHAFNHSTDGDSRSYGAVLVEVKVKRARLLHFIVAASGDKPWKDQELAEMLAGAIVADLIEEGYIEPVTPDSPTFILGADPEQVKKWAVEMADK